MAVRTVGKVFSQALVKQRLNGRGKNLCQLYKTHIQVLKMSLFMFPGLRFFTCEVGTILGLPLLKAVMMSKHMCFIRCDVY